MWGELISAIVGLLVGLVAGFASAFLSPVQALIEVRGRRAFKVSPVDVNVEDDLSVIWAGFPDWESHRFFIPGQETSAPPSGTLGQWQTWVTEHRGFDLSTSTLRLTVVSRVPVTVVIGPPIVEASTDLMRQRGYALNRLTGGASMHPLGVDVHLQGGGPWSSVSDNDGPVGGPLSWSLDRGEAQQFLLRVSAADDSLWLWTAKMPVIIDGHRQMVIIDNGGEPFKLAGDLAAPLNPS